MYLSKKMDGDDKHSLKIEATEVIKEIRFAVNSVELSNDIPNDNESVYFNLETKEDHRFCVELSVRGFRLAGKQFNVVDHESDESKYYETIYALLDSISLGYRNTFGDTLIQKLQCLQDGHHMQEPRDT